MFYDSHNYCIAHYYNEEQCNNCERKENKILVCYKVLKIFVLEHRAFSIPMYVARCLCVQLPKLHFYYKNDTIERELEMLSLSTCACSSLKFDSIQYLLEIVRRKFIIKTMTRCIDYLIHSLLSFDYSWKL